MLLTPKSVNDMLNTKVQRYWETPSQPSGSCGSEDEKVKIKVGNQEGNGANFLSTGCKDIDRVSQRQKKKNKFNLPMRGLQ